MSTSSDLAEFYLPELCEIGSIEQIFAEHEFLLAGIVIDIGCVCFRKQRHRVSGQLLGVAPAVAIHAVAMGTSIGGKLVEFLVDQCAAGNSVRLQQSTATLTADTISNLGCTYLYKGKYNAAIGCYQHSLRIKEKAFGVDHIAVRVLGNGS